LAAVFALVVREPDLKREPCPRAIIEPLPLESYVERPAESAPAAAACYFKNFCLRLLSTA